MIEAELKKLKTAQLRKMADGMEIENGEMERADIIKAILEKSNGNEAGEGLGQKIGDLMEQSEATEIPETPDIPEVKTPSIGTGMKEEHFPAGGKAEIMKKILMAQPKVQIYIPLLKGEKFGTTTSVILNGYTLHILKGQYVSVPQQVAEVIMDSLKQTREALETPLRVDGAGPNALQRE